MRQRPAALVLPTHAPFYTAELPGIGDVRLVPLRNRDRDAWISEVQRVEARPRDVQTAADSKGLNAAVIGLGWAHPELEVEADRAAFGTLAEYGRAVIDELEDAGVPLASILALGKRAADEQIAELREVADAAARVPFSRGKKADTASSSSEPVPGTAAPRGRSRNSPKSGGPS